MKIKKFLAGFLSAMMVISLLPSTAFATEIDTSDNGSGGESVVAEHEHDFETNAPVLSEDGTTLIYTCAVEGCDETYEEEYVPDTPTVMNDGDSNSGDGSNTVEAEGCVAQIGDGDNAKTFATLQEAIESAGNTETSIILLSNITEDITISSGQNITLNLGEYTLTNLSANTITNSGTLTIVGSGTVESVVSGKGALINYGTANLQGGAFCRDDANLEKSYYTVINQGTMTVNGAEISNTGTEASCLENGWYNDDDVTGNAELTVISGKISGGLNALKNDAGGVLDIRGGEITNSTQYAIMNWNQATISGGEITCTAAYKSGSGVYPAAIYNQAGENTSTSEGKLTISGGDITTIESSTYALDNRAEAAISGTAKLTGGSSAVQSTGSTSITTVSGGTLVGTRYYAVTASDHSTVEITGGIFEGNYYVVRAANVKITIADGTFTNTAGTTTVYVGSGTVADINGGVFSGASKYAVNNYGGQLTISGGEFTSKGSAVYVNNTNSAVTTISGGEFTTTDNSKAVVTVGANGTLTVSGGAFSGKVSEEYLAEGYIYNSENGTITSLGVASITDNDGNIIYYETLQAAIEACSEGQIVKLVVNTAEDIIIASGKNITLDLNGKSLTNVSDHTITNSGILTITDSSAGTVGTVDNVTHAKAAIYNTENATCTIWAGKFSRSKENGQSGEDNGGNSFYTINNYGTMTIGSEGGENDITVTANGHYSSLVHNGWQNSKDAVDKEAKMTIYGGTFTGGINTIKNDESGYLTITGGTFTNVTQYALQNWNVAEISGGTFESNTMSAVYNGADAVTSAGKLTITGGTFTAPDNSCVVYNDTDTGAESKIIGGTYSSQYYTNNNSELNYTSVENEDGTYGVAICTEDNAVASVTVGEETTYYPTLENAIAGAKSNETISLLKDIQYVAMTVVDMSGKTLDLGNHKITGNNIDTIIFTGKDFTIQNGCFSTTGSYSLWIGDDPETNKVTVKNVTTTGGINVYNASNVILENVTSVGNTHYAVWADCGAEITISSGNYSTNGTYGLLGATYGNADEEAPSGIVKVAGGTFKINDNKFAPSGNDNIEISGGIFNSKVPVKYCADGYIPVKNDDDTYGVEVLTEENAIASVTNADNSIQYYSTLDAALAVVEDGEIVKLLKDTSIGSTILRKPFTLDLGNNTLNIDSNASGFYGLAVLADTTIKNGSIVDLRTETYSSDSISIGNRVIQVQDCNFETENLKIQFYDSELINSTWYNYGIYILDVAKNETHPIVKLGTGTEIQDAAIPEYTYTNKGYGIGVALMGSNDLQEENSAVAKLELDGAKIVTTGFAVSGHGTSHGTSIAIANSTVKSTLSTAIYHPQMGILNIKEGAVIEGANAGIELRAGELNMSGGTVKGTNKPTEVNPNGNGTTSSGAGIAIAQHTTKLPITVNITSGTIEGFSALYESNPQKNDADDLAKINLSISGGTFTAINEGTIAVYSEDFKEFISGGTFSSDVTEYCAVGKEAVQQNADGMYTIEVGKYDVVLYSALEDGQTVSVSDVTGGRKDITYGTSVTVNATKKDGYEFLGWYKVTEKTEGNGTVTALQYDKTLLSDQLSYTFAAERDMELVAVYKAVAQVKLTVAGNSFKVNGELQSQTNYTDYFNAGTEITVESLDSKFYQWTNGSDKIVSTSKSYTFRLVTDTTLYANALTEAGAGAENTALVEFVSYYNQVIQATTWSTGSTYNLPTGPSKMGCTFKYWSMDGTTEATTDTIKQAISSGEKHITLKPVYGGPTEKYSVTVQYPNNTTENYSDILAGDGVTVAAKMIEGKTFSHWSDAAEDGTVLSYNSSYLVRVAGNMTLYAIYVNEGTTVEGKPTIVMSNSYASVVNDKTKISFSVTRSIPDGYTLVEQGVLYSSVNSSVETMQIGIDGTNKYTSPNMVANGVTTLNITVTDPAKTMYTRGYMILINDATGNIETIYTDKVASGSYNSLNSNE